MLSPDHLKAICKQAALGLADHHSCWCAWCLGYIETRDQLELHHMFSRAMVRDLFRPKPFLDSWTVPVHVGTCHHALQHHSDTAVLALAQAASLSSLDLDLACRVAFFAGDLSRGLYLRELRHRSLLGEADPLSLAKNLVHEFNCAAGSTLITTLLSSRTRAGRSWKERIHGKGWKRLIKKAGMPVFWEFYAEDAFANGGRFREAEGVLRHAESEHPRWKKRSHAAWGALNRRSALLRARLSEASEAVRIAREEDDSYNLRTALLARSWAYFSQGQYGRALDGFYQVEPEVSGIPFSFWHRFCDELGIGCALFAVNRGHDLAASLGFLLRAQYISAMMGLQGNPVPDPRRESHPAPSFVAPTDVIQWIGRIYPEELPPERMRALREEALLGLRDLIVQRFLRSPFEWP